MKNIAIITDQSSLPLERSIADFLTGRRIGFWHRVPNVWLLEVEEAMDLQNLQNEIALAANGNPSVIVLEVAKWSAIAPPEWSGWFVKHWGALGRQEAPRDSRDMQAAGVNAA